MNIQHPIATGVSGMKLITGSEFLMGSDCFYPEEAPARRVHVGDFLIDERPVTNVDFERFVQATGYVTVAERAPLAENYPGLSLDLLRAGSSVFVGVGPGLDATEELPWWQFVPGAYWRCPYGADSFIGDKGEHPVVHVTFEDALAYSTWAGKCLPTEAEWEFASRGGIDGADYAWGDELAPDGRMMANYWQGAFPYTNLAHDGWERTSPVGSFPPNGYGLYDMIGNVWEWTEDWWTTPGAREKGIRTCCAQRDAAPSLAKQSADLGDPMRIPRKVIKGGSHLCAPNYCQRYRPAARHPQAIDTGTTHIGFRCVIRIDSNQKSMP